MLVSHVVLTLCVVVSLIDPLLQSLSNSSHVLNYVSLRTQHRRSHVLTGVSVSLNIFLLLLRVVDFVLSLGRSISGCSLHAEVIRS
jgi:hypothetical protein